MHRSRGRSLILLGLVAALGCGAPPAEQPAQLTKVRVSMRKHLSWGPLMIAQAEGFFREEGLEIEEVTTQRPQESLVALVTGDLDVMPGPLHAGFLSAIGRGASVRIAGGMGNLGPQCTYFGIVLRKGLDTTGTPSIKRARVGQDGGSRYLAETMFGSRKVFLKDIESVYLPEAVMATALESGSLDAIAVSEPSLLRLTKLGTLWLKGEDAVPGFQWAVIAFGDRLLNRDRETGMRFMRAYQRGVDQYLKGKTDRNVAIIAAATGETVEHTREVCWPDFDPRSRINWESIAAFQAWASAQGHLLKVLSQNEAFDSAFVAAITASPDSTH